MTGQFPQNLRYTKDHEWILMEGGVATVGITDFAQGELGDVVFVDVPKVGKTVKARDVLCVVESTKAASDVYSPVGGKVKEVNTALTNKPELINSDPYKGGWIAKLEGVSEAEVSALMDAAAYKNLLGDKA